MVIDREIDGRRIRVVFGDDSSLIRESISELAPRPVAADDADLLRGAAAGDWDCVAALYDRHREKALAVATSVLADPSEAEDVVHDAFVDLPRMARSFDPRRGRFTQWLYRSVRNRAIDHVRRRARSMSHTAPSGGGLDGALALTPAVGASPLEEAMAHEFLDLVAQLDGRHAQLIRLAFVDGWSHSAIARLTGLPLGTVKTRIRNGLRQLRAIMAEAETAAVTSGEPDLRADGVIAAFTRDARLAASVAAHTSGMARVEVVDVLPARGSPPPDGAVIDLRSASSTMGEMLDHLDGFGWGRVPILLLTPVRGRQAIPLRRDRLSLAVEAGDPPHLDLESAVVALLSASTRSAVRDRAIDRLVLGDRAAVVVGDRLGRIQRATTAAALLFGRTPRQLCGSFVTDLSAMPPGWTERQWLHLASTGRWAGRSLVRRSTGSPVPIWGRAWMSPGGGFVGVYAPDTLA